MKISFLPAVTLSPTGDYKQKTGKEKTGTLLQQAELSEVIKACNTIEKAPEKHQNGSIFPYISRTLGKESWTEQDGLTDGVIFVDIDNITKSVAETIFNSFEEIADRFPCLYAIQYSSSYYLSKDKAGVHIYICSPVLDEVEYRYLATLALAVIARYILIVTGIDLRNPIIGNNIILDSHNTSIMQRFFLYYSEYKINEGFCEAFTEDIIEKASLTKLKEEYKSLNFPTKNTTYIHREIKIDVQANNIVKDKICIDRNFTIGKYSGNDVRWRISKIAQILFKDNAKEWCDKYFYCENGKSIFTKQTSEKYPSLVIKNWLEDNNYLTSTKKNIIKKGEYIIKYKDEILEFIKNNRKVEIVAPTGVGKTTLINGQKNSVKDIDLFTKEEDIFSLAHKLNAIVIVPFNVTNRLYDNLIEVSSETNHKVEADKPAVMIWDQALKHWTDIKERILIIDEAHCLFLDRRYRDTAIKLMNKIKEDNCKIVLFTATPSGEGSELGCEYLTFSNERNTIMTDFVLVNNIDVAQYNYIKAALKNDWFDKIVLFDDTTAKKIYEKLYCDGEFINDIAYIRADTKNTPDFIKLRNEELLSKKLTICTCVAFNGLNFKNKDERVLVITSYNQGNTTSCEIIQEAGRIRNSEVYLKIYFDEKIRDYDVREYIKKAELLHTIESNLGIPEGLLQYNRRLIDEDVQESLKKIQDYLTEKSKLETIVEELKEANYFYMRLLDKKNDELSTGNRMNLAFKKKESDDLIKDLMDGTILEKEYNEDNVNNYKINWKNQIKKMIHNNTYKGITLETFQEFYKNSNKKTLISTIIDKLYKAVNISLLTEDEWNAYVNNKDIVIKMLGNDKVAIKQVVSSYNQNMKIRSKYNDMIVIKEDNTIDLSLLFTDVIAEAAANYYKECEAKAEVKNKQVTITENFKHPEKYNLEIGQTFNSCTELANYTGKSIQSVSAWNNKLWIK